MKKTTKIRIEMAMAAIVAALSGGIVFYILGWSDVLLVYYLMSLALAVIAMRSMFQIPDSGEPLTPRHRLLSVALGLSVGLVATIGLQILLAPPVL